MSHRTEVTLSDDQYARLCEESQRTGLGLSELIGRAVEGAYDRPPTEAEREAFIKESLAILEETAGLWKDRDFDGVTYVERIRRGLDPDTGT